MTAAAGDEVSVAIAAVFGGFGREYQAVCGQWAEFEQRFARALGAGAGVCRLRRPRWGRCRR
nr:PE family protein [Mycobacterium shottsii]